MVNEMEIIKKLEKFMDKKIKMADCEIDFALVHKDTEPEIAKLFYELSCSELQDFADMHGHIVTIINAYRRDRGEPPKEMMAVYEYQHEIDIDDMASVKAKQAMYTGK